MEQETLDLQAKQLAECLREAGLRMATAESCTGGWIAKTCTDLAGSSEWFECGFVTYSNTAKQDMLEVSADTLETHGAVSEATAAEMVRGAIANSLAEVAVAVTGIAGPGGATENKPVGMVCFGWITPDQPAKTETVYFDGDREAVRAQTVHHAMHELIRLLP
ncbi:MAG: CinA family protein [Thiolinea sp.]